VPSRYRDRHHDQTSEQSNQRQQHDDAAVAVAVTETPHVQSLDAADESRELERGRVDLIRLGRISFNRATFEPGWRWSEHAGRDGSCQERHLGYLVSGRMSFQMDDGIQVDAGPATSTSFHRGMTPGWLGTSRVWRSI